jgi:hypothetical protein
MTYVEKLQARLVAADAAFVDKVEKQPHCSSNLRLYQGDEGFEADMWAFNSGPKQYITGVGPDPDAAIDDLLAKIARLPSAKERGMHEFQDMLGKLIDKGRDVGVAVDFINPLTALAEDLAENAITYQPEATT